jgi:hypothetical protein
MSVLGLKTGENTNLNIVSTPTIPPTTLIDDVRISTNKCPLIGLVL